MELKKGSIGKLTWNENRVCIGIITNIDTNRVYLLDVCGEEKTVPKGTVNSFSATKSLTPEARAALKSLMQLEAKKETEFERHRAAIEKISSEKKKVHKALKKATGTMSSLEFVAEVENFLRNRYRCRVSAWSPKSITISFETMVDKWARPEQYAFLYREYDQTLHISDEKAATAFAKKHAPGVIGSLVKAAKKQQYELELGDKNTIIAQNCLYFEHNGYTQASLDALLTKLQ